jgi:hypothetical protein
MKVLLRLGFIGEKRDSKQWEKCSVDIEASSAEFLVPLAGKKVSGCTF